MVEFSYVLGVFYMSLSEFVKYLKDIAWGPYMLTLLVCTGVFLSYRVGFIQLTKFRYIMKNTIGKIFEKKQADEGEISPFQAMTTALAATVGTGNIAGVTGAIAIGGPGAVFWMWLSAFFGMVTKYTEVVLAVKYREKNEQGEWVGGPMYYIKNGLGPKFKWLASLFCVLGALAAFGIGNMTQINTIASSMNTLFKSFGFTSGTFTVLGEVIPFTSLIIGVIAALLVALVLFGGIKRIGSVTEMLVPFMALLYVVTAIIVIIFNIHLIDDIFIMIIKGAFNADAALGGIFGITIMKTIRNGIGRGVFSNEAGLGSAPMAHASTSETNPIKQGFYGVFEVFMDTIVVCSMTSFVLLCGYLNGVTVTWGQSAGAELISLSMGTVYGNQIGSLIIAICISLFALSTLLSWSLYGTRCCEFLFGTRFNVIYQVIFIIFIVVGACAKLDLVWDIADTLNGFMAIPNLIALLGLSNIVVNATKEYFKHN